ncbi:class I lanthipeptide [Chitinophaga nivalis]|uniref:Class I lanthipeptide n=1 Tax=Chitinophaga nivalis TaxID=2991709 RepID=A0ABT3ILB0_9BACT|nr:class I lanthipeptide [Chitinophaga nivalis]MCW3465557.1 class I lanthipeptide [Chitinophaga nivalis]MCW3484752.1 class I lanthipeptide [Chitinophaga nivalis]
MKRKQISLSKKLFLDKSRIAALNADQQLRLEGGAISPDGRVAITDVTWCGINCFWTKLVGVSCPRICTI